MKKILCFMLWCILLVALTACGNSADGQLSDSVISSAITEEIGDSPLEETQDTQIQMQTPAEEESISEPEIPAINTSSKEQAQPPLVKQPQPNTSTGAKSAEKPSSESPPKPTPPVASEENTVSKMNVQVGNNTFTATLADNSAVDALVEMMKKSPVVIQMSDYSGFEKVGSLGSSLPTDNRQMTAKSGDIVLYGGNQIVVFYGSNSWSYTRLGKIDDLLGWEEALGGGDAEVIFSLE